MFNDYAISSSVDHLRPRHLIGYTIKDHLSIGDDEDSNFNMSLSAESEQNIVTDVIEVAIYSYV